MNRRTLEEAAAIAGEHLTPADKVERAFRDARIARAVAQRKYEESHELIPRLASVAQAHHVQSRVARSSENSEWQCGVAQRFSEVFPDATATIGLFLHTVSFDMKRALPIPEWANWLAVCGSGSVEVCEKRPWHAQPIYGPCWHPNMGTAQRIGTVSPRPDWREKLCPLTEAAWKEWRNER